MAKEKLNIAVDCDDVLVPVSHAIAKEYYQRYGIQVTLQDFYSGRPEVWGVSDIKIAEQRVNEYLVSEAFTAIKPFADAVAAVQRLAQAHNLYMVTARIDELIPATRLMVENFFPNCFVGLEFTNHHGELHKQRSKGTVCRELEIDVLIDDNPFHIRRAMTEAALAGGIVFGDYPWNSDMVAEAPKVERCYSWLEVERNIERIANS